jgi:DegV family protein with EDD domain
MAYHIAVDSCTDMNASMKEDEHITLVPLTLHVGEDRIIDDETFDQASFLAKVAACPEAPSSACPSPDAFMKAYGYNSEDAYGITLSAELSGSYNSAKLGADLLKEEYPDKNIHVFNSRSACCGQTLILLKIQECLEKGMKFDEVVSCVEHYISEQTTLFVLESLETLRKNGRLSNLKAALVNVLNIKPVMSSTPEGTIEQVDMGRGMKKALSKMVNHIGNTVIHPTEKILAISHCNCLERAQWVKVEIEKKYAFKDIIIIDTAGVGSMYANDGGIVIAY